MNLPFAIPLLPTYSAKYDVVISAVIRNIAAHDSIMEIKILTTISTIFLETMNFLGDSEATVFKWPLTHGERVVEMQNALQDPRFFRFHENIRAAIE